MGPAALAFCLSLGVPADTPGYGYAERIAELSVCVSQADDAGDIRALGQVLDVYAKCLSYCER